MANTISSDLQLDLVLSSAMEEFSNVLLPLGLFSTVIRDVALAGTDKVDVPYYPLETAASKDKDGSDYQFNVGTEVGVRPVTVNKRKYQPLSFTSEELARQPAFDPVKFGQLKGRKLAEDVLADILSLVTASNFGLPALEIAAASFDMDSVIDLGVVADTAKWPANRRGLVLPHGFAGNLKKDIVANGGTATFGFNGVTRPIDKVDSFNFVPSNVIPANGEDLAGFIVHPSAILVAFSPIPPTEEVRAQLTAYAAITDPVTGITLEYRAWGDPDSDVTKQTIEANYGFGLGEANALKRIVLP